MYLRYNTGKAYEDRRLMVNTKSSSTDKWPDPSALEKALIIGTIIFAFLLVCSVITWLGLAGFPSFADWLLSL